MEQTFKKGDRVVCDDGEKGTYYQPNKETDGHLLLRDNGDCSSWAPYYSHTTKGLRHDRDFHVGDWVRYEGTHPSIPDTHLNGQIGKISALLNQDTVSVDDIYNGAGIFRCNLVKIAPPTEEASERDCMAEYPGVPKKVTIEHDQWGRVEGVKLRGTNSWFKDGAFRHRADGWREVKPKRWVRYALQEKHNNDPWRYLSVWFKEDSTATKFELPPGYRWKKVEIEREEAG